MHNKTYNIGNKAFENRDRLRNHKPQLHKEAEIPVVKSIFKEPIGSKQQEEKVQMRQNMLLNKHMCKECNISFKANLELIEHNKNMLIHDTWPDSGSKRDVSMIKTSSVHEPRKKKVAEEEDMLERSKNMDRKILEKRKWKNSRKLRESKN